MPHLSTDCTRDESPLEASPIAMLSSHQVQPMPRIIQSRISTCTSPSIYQPPVEPLSTTSNWSAVLTSQRSMRPTKHNALSIPSASEREREESKVRLLHLQLATFPQPSSTKTSSALIIFTPDEDPSSAPPLRKSLPKSTSDRRQRITTTIDRRMSITNAATSRVPLFPIRAM